jgi:hypothetical protein
VSGTPQIVQATNPKGLLKTWSSQMSWPHVTHMCVQRCLRALTLLLNFMRKGAAVGPLSSWAGSSTGSPTRQLKGAGTSGWDLYHCRQAGRQSRHHVQSIPAGISCTG